jgi:hypothetical protein
MSEPSKKSGVATWALSGLVSVGLLASAGAKLAGAAPIVENFEKFHLAPYRVGIGVIELVCAALFLLPRTSSLGTLLVTGYFGGAIVAHLTAGDVPGSAPAAVLGALAWAANYLRNPDMFGSFKR